ncbi:uncharacterized protein LOC143275756 [Babylonia areolata]|uniref:uncharacterized protein LOC143275756 n=1 Tax=Babylonia areolata TaxID=304850 RepID=UPI003FD5FD31
MHLLTLIVNLSTFRSLYVRMAELQLTGSPSRVLHNVTSEMCARTCVEEVTFECKSFDLDHVHGACSLFNTSYEDGVAFLQESSFVDHYRSAFEKLFSRLPNHVITVSHKRKVPEASVEQCARRCVFEMTFHCRGFDYEPQHRNCWLTDLSVETSGSGVKFHHGADFYERVLDGPTTHFVNYGVGSLPLVDGYQIYNKVMFGVTLGACAQLCLTQTTFECSSFDFSFNEQSCHMSEYTAAELNGLSHGVTPSYRVMHYEKKGQYLNFFYPTPYTIILGRNDKTVQRVSPDSCAKYCLQEKDFVCRSFDYQIRNGSCLLSSTTGSDVGRLYYQGQAQAHHFEMKPFLDCGAVLTEASGTFASPNWPRDYEHNLNCTWHVRVAKHKVINFDFVHFQLGPRGSNPCDVSSDRLVISDKTSRGPTTFCATSPMTSYTSGGNEVTLQLLTNGAVDAAGFLVSFSADWPCKSVLTEDNGQIASPSWPLQYPPLLDCRWTVRAPPHARVLLQFTSVDLDAQSFGGCSGGQFDVLEVFDGDSPASKSLAKLCGRGGGATTFTSEGRALVVTFRTDAHVQRTGFHAAYKFLYMSTTTTTTTTTTSSTTASTSTTAAVAAAAASSSTTDGGGGNKHFRDMMTSLTAQFVEPRRDVLHHWRFSTPPLAAAGSTTKGLPVDEVDESGDYLGPILQPSNQVSETFVRTMWTLVVCLVLMLVLVLAILIFVCRHYRKRSPKRRTVPSYTFTEEELSLYEKDTLTSVSTQNVNSSGYKFHSDPDPEITFSNPLYESRYPPPSHIASRTTSITTMTSLSRC